MFENDFSQAVNLYEENRLKEAIDAFHSLLKKSSADDELSKIFYYLGNIFMECGMRCEALSTWKSSLRVLSSPPVKKRVLSIINSYGMVRTDKSVNDDFKAFSSIQLKKYLNGKINSRFGSLAEADMVMELLFEGWSRFQEEYNLLGINPEKKLFLFRGFKIDFPIKIDEGATIIEFNFRTKEVVKGEELCSCGSGLPYFGCCGAVEEPSVYLNGLK